MTTPLPDGVDNLTGDEAKELLRGAIAVFSSEPELGAALMVAAKRRLDRGYAKPHTFGPVSKLLTYITDRAREHKNRARGDRATNK